MFHSLFTHKALKLDKKELRLRRWLFKIILSLDVILKGTKKSNLKLQNYFIKIQDGIFSVSSKNATVITVAHNTQWL